MSKQGMTRLRWAALALLTTVNVCAAGVAVYVTSNARADFRAAAEPIGQMGLAILDSMRRLEARDAR